VNKLINNMAGESKGRRWRSEVPWQPLPRKSGPDPTTSLSDLIDVRPAPTLHGSRVFAAKKRIFPKGPLSISRYFCELRCHTNDEAERR